MDTVAVIGSCDTKAREVAYMRELLEAWGLNVLVIDVATGPGPSENYDISREAVAEAAGASWETVKT